VCFMSAVCVYNLLTHIHPNAVVHCTAEGSSWSVTELAGTLLKTLPCATWFHNVVLFTVQPWVVNDTQISSVFHIVIGSDILSNMTHTVLTVGNISSLIPPTIKVKARYRLGEYALDEYADDLNSCKDNPVTTIVFGSEPAKSIEFLYGDFNSACAEGFCPGYWYDAIPRLRLAKTTKIPLSQSYPFISVIDTLEAATIKDIIPMSVVCEDGFVALGTTRTFAKSLNLVHREVLGLDLTTWGVRVYLSDNYLGKDVGKPQFVLYDLCRLIGRMNNCNTVFMHANSEVDKTTHRCVTRGYVVRGVSTDFTSPSYDNIVYGISMSFVGAANLAWTIYASNMKPAKRVPVRVKRVTNSKKR
jgi:hypothetical protein